MGPSLLIWFGDLGQSKYYFCLFKVVYDSHDPYVKYFYTDFLTSQVYPNTARILRFTLDIENSRVMYAYLIPQETIAADFPQINHAFDERHYKWAYLVSVMCSG